MRGSGALLLGPNCLGVFDGRAALDIGWSELPAGSIGLVSQSGNLALELALLAGDYGLGFSRFASLGNQADVEASDLVRDLAADSATKVIALYVEDFRDGRAFALACEEAVAGGTPVLLIAAGRSEASGRAAQSHTGALVSDRVAVAALCRAAGIVQVATARELADAAQAALLVADRPHGLRLGIFGDGGGQGVIASDLADAAGFELPRLSDALGERLEAALGPTSATRNPVDFAGGGEQDLARFELVARLLLESGEVDATLLTGYFGGYATYGGEYEATEARVARAMGRTAAEAGRPLVAHTMYPSLGTAAALRESGVPVYREIESAVAALRRLVEIETAARSGVPDLPSPATRVVPGEGDGDYFAARQLLEAGGVPFVPARRIGDLDEALAAALELGYPVALKALGLLHKSDAGGVVLGIDGPEELSAAFSDLATRLEATACSVERMAPLEAGVELIAGVRSDPRFGPIALVGIGGLYAELLADVAVALAPVSRAQAADLLRSLRGAPLLLGARGRPALALDAAAEALAALSRVGAAHPEITEIEVNPLLVTAACAVGLDARLVFGEEGDDDAR